MKEHPYLRAYMAGILLPSWFLLLIVTALVVAHVNQQRLAGLESAIVFPMAVVPNLWGLWNVLYARLGLRGRVSLGAFGALLPLLLVPAGVWLASLMGLGVYTARHAAGVLPVAMALYFLIWKYAVGFFNRVAGLS